LSRLRPGFAEAALGGFALGLGLAGAGVDGTPFTIAAFASAGAVTILSRSGVASFRLVTIGGGAALACAFLAGGLLIGAARVTASDQSALTPPVGKMVTVSGFLMSPPERLSGGALAVLDTSDGRIALVAESVHGFPGIGVGLDVTGVVARPEAWRRAWFRRNGVAAVLRLRSLRATGSRRGGLDGRIDSIRERASAALGRGIGAPEAALARGFVLGSDEEIDPVTVQRFRRSGLSHLLAVSGQNVVLLGLLVMPLLSLAGLTLRARLVSLLLLIATYVLVTGAGPSIQRAGVMGAAAVAAGLAGRPVVRLHALLLAAVATLLVNPLAVGDPGWQLSFAATAGIMAWAPRLASGLRGQARAGAVRASLAEAVAVCLAATVSTLPLLLGTFDSLPIASLPANLLVTPAVAPSMWLGMIAAGVGQVGWLPTAPINALNALCLAYIEQVAAWVGDLPWSTVEASMSPLALGITTVVVLVGFELAVRALIRRRGVRLPAPSRPGLALLAVALALLLVVGVGMVGFGGGRTNGSSDDRMVVCALDVGQGDALLLDPPGPTAALVDAGPPGADIATALEERDVRRLTHLIITHDQLDHAGGAPEVLAALPVEWLIHTGASARLGRLAEQAGLREAVVSEGSTLRLGGLDLLISWPPRALSAEPDPGADPNAISLVLTGRWRHLTFLLTGDSEAEATPMPGGQFDLLKVAHHGSEDQGLGQMLDGIVPRVALISVGTDNPYGHPSSSTVDELLSRRIHVLRTDTGGSVGVAASARGWRAGSC